MALKSIDKISCLIDLDDQWSSGSITQRFPCTEKSRQEHNPWRDVYTTLLGSLRHFSLRLLALGARGNLLLGQGIARLIMYPDIAGIHIGIQQLVARTVEPFALLVPQVAVILGIQVSFHRHAVSIQIEVVTGISARIAGLGHRLTDGDEAVSQHIRLFHLGPGLRRNILFWRRINS